MPILKLIGIFLCGKLVNSHQMLLAILLIKAFNFSNASFELFK